MPIGRQGQDCIGGTEVTQAALRAGGLTAIHDHVDAFLEQLTGDDNRFVRRPQVFPRAINDRPHQLLRCTVLRVHAQYPRKCVRALHLAVDHPIVRPVAKRPKRVDIDVHAKRITRVLGVGCVFAQRVVVVVVEIPNDAVSPTVRSMES